MLYCKPGQETDTYRDIVEEFITKRCIVSFTKHRKPYIGALIIMVYLLPPVENGYSPCARMHQEELLLI